MTTKLTLSQMSDHLAEHLLGWRQHSDGKFWLNWSNSNKAINSAWRPHEDVTQCFAYIIPALQARGFYFEIFHDLMTWTCKFCDTRGNNFYSNSHPYNTSEPARAIVEAAYLAISQES